VIGGIEDKFLPRDWMTVSLKAIITKLVDGSHNPPSKRESGVPMLSARNILNGQILFEEYRLISEEDFEKEHTRTRISPGDVLLTIVGTIGRSAVVPASAQRFSLQRSVAVITPTGVLPKYLMYQFQAPFLQRYFEKNARGTAQKGVYLKTLSQTPILVAPLGQQQRIVAEIEKQFSRLDETVANLKRVKANLKRYKAAVLKAAVEGKLTEDWRKQHPNVEPASKLLERILAERRAKWTGKGKYKVPTAPDTSDLPNVPDRWSWATMPQLGELNRGKSKHRPRNDPKLFGGPYPFIQTGDVKHSGGFVRSHSQTYNESGLTQSRLWPAGTLCITIAANIAETGILTYPACFPDSVVGFVIDSTPVTVRFIDLFFRTEREEIARFAPATAQKNINLEILSEVAVPFPPPEEQKEIVAEGERRLSVIEELEFAIQANLTRADRLRRSILSRAFEGRMIPHEPVPCK
jgi:type I restriction enzyme S subunit